MSNYRVILVANSTYKKTLHRSKTRETAFLNFWKLVENNKKVIFPKQFINYKKIVPVKHKIFIVKDTEPDDEFRLVKDKIGRTYYEKPLYGIWTILNDSEYMVEETFWLYGRNPKKDRIKINDIVKLLMLDVSNLKNIKQIVVVHNKLIIFNEVQFEMVICKCKLDAQRLQNKLSDATLKNKIKNIIFMGTASKANIGRYYDLIHEKTKWPYSKIYRRTTRP